MPLPNRWVISVESFALKFLFSILPLSFDRQREAFLNRPKDLVLSIVLLVLFAIVGPIVCVLLFTLNFSAANRITNALSAFQFTFMYFLILVVQIIFIRKKESLHVLLNDLFHLKHMLERMMHRSMSEFRLYTLFFLKMFLVDFLMQLLSLYTYDDNTLLEGDSIMCASSLIFYAMMCFISVIENFILLGVLICAVMQVMINAIIKRLARSPHWQGKEGPPSGRPSVLQMYMLHCKNGDIVKQFMETLNFATLMLTGWYFFMIVYSVYFMYAFAFEASQRGIKLDEFHVYINPMIFFLYQCVQLYLIVLVPSVYTDHAKKMMRLLNYVIANQHQHLPAQERLIEILMVDCMQRNYSISNYGMYSMNRALLFGMIATMTSYLIILIQFHIQEYE